MKSIQNRFDFNNMICKFFLIGWTFILCFFFFIISVLSFLWRFWVFFYYRYIFLSNHSKLIFNSFHAISIQITLAFYSRCQCSRYNFSHTNKIYFISILFNFFFYKSWKRKLKGIKKIYNKTILYKIIWFNY